MESADVERRAELLARPIAQLDDLQLADLVSERLARLVGLAIPGAHWLAGPDGQGVIAIVIGLSLLAAGLLDHQYLVRSMRPPATPAQAAEPASNPRAEPRS